MSLPNGLHRFIVKDETGFAVNIVARDKKQAAAKYQAAYGPLITCKLIITPA